MYIQFTKQENSGEEYALKEVRGAISRELVGWRGLEKKTRSENHEVDT